MSKNGWGLVEALSNIKPVYNYNVLLVYTGDRLPYIPLKDIIDFYSIVNSF